MTFAATTNATNALVRYEAARNALAEAHSVDEAKEIHDQAAAMEAYARQAKDMQLIQWSTEIRMRAVRKIGLMMEVQRDAQLMARGGGDGSNQFQRATGSTADPVADKPQPITLAEAGIDKHLADKARKFADRTEDEFETFLAKAVQKVSDGIEGRKANRTSFTADNEWFTPPEYIELARHVLGGIDLDPASHRVAQKLVQAKKYFTPNEDGLSHEWHGSVWLNPPYSQPAIGKFVEKLVGEFSAKRVSEAILLTHNYTDTAWFHTAAGSAMAICFTRGRIRFVALDGGIAAPTQGQAFFYFGAHLERFGSVFSEVGLVVAQL